MKQCVHNSHAVVHHFVDGVSRPCLCGRYADVAACHADNTTVEEQEAQEQAEAVAQIRREESK